MRGEGEGEERERRKREERRERGESEVREKRGKREVGEGGYLHCTDVLMGISVGLSQRKLSLLSALHHSR